MDHEHWPEQTRAFAEVFRTRTRAEWSEVFAAVDACVTPVLELDEAPEHPHNVARNGFLIGPDDQLHVAPAPRFSRTPGSLRRGAPAPGSHRREVLRELGLESAEVERLQDEGAFGPAREAESDP